MTTAIILAGGQGTRLRSVVKDVPKPMAVVGGRPFLEHQLDYWITQGVLRFIISVGYRKEVISEHFGTAYGGARIEYSEEASPLGTGGGLLLAASMLHRDSPFLLLNGDTFFAVELAHLKAFAESHEADWTLSVFPSEPGGRYLGLDVLPSGRIRGLASTLQDGTSLVNGGVYWVKSRSIFSSRPPGSICSLENDLLPEAILAGTKVFGLPCRARFIDIGLPADYQRAQTFLLSP